MKTNRKHNIFETFMLVFSLFSTLLLPACKHNDSDDTVIPFVVPEVRTYARTLSVAIVLPLQNGSLQKKRFERVVEWYAENLKNTQDNIQFNFEWYDEESKSEEEIEKLAETLANRADLFAVVGPLYSSHLETFAEKCFVTKKPLIAPCASSENVIRSFAINAANQNKREPFLWTLTETDNSQIEAVISKIAAYKGKKVALLSSADVYGRTFFEWMPFTVTEFNVELIQNVRYTSENTGKAYEAGTAALPLDAAVQTVFTSEADFIICALSSHKDAKTVLEARETYLNDKNTQLFFTDTAFTAELLEYGDLVEGVEGTAPFAAPESGFLNMYKARFNDETPVIGEAHLYDSLMLLGFAAAYCHKNDSPEASGFTNEKVNAALMSFNGTLKGGVNAWTPVGMIQVFKSISDGNTVNVNGATGLLDFDKETYTSVVRSVYVHWAVIEGKFINLDYNTTAEDGSDKTASTRASWIWNISTNEEELKKTVGVEMTYDDLESKWAVLVAASTGWANYRHQADILFVYQILKKNGFPDDHIVLILADDIANYKRNKNKGTIIARPGGENLYTDDVQIDYLVSELDPEKISEILCGGQPVASHEPELLSAHPKLAATPTVLNTDSHANILWFWSGHGSNKKGSSKDGFFVWADGQSGDNFTTELMKTTLEKMQSENRFRKLLIATETCYSASVMHVADGIPGVLAFTAANGIETSLADLFSVDLKVWLSNRFTRNFTDILISEKMELPFSALYTHISKNTIGSHVCIINPTKFGNLYLNSPKEFFAYN